MAKENLLGEQASMVFAITGLIFAAPSSFLPFISASKLGDVRDSLLLTGPATAWHHDMRTLAALVVLCGLLLPIVFLVSMILMHLPPVNLHPSDRRLLTRVAHFLDHWAFPEVQVLAVLVALMRLGGMVEVSVGSGFWCYCAMSIFLLLSQRGFEFELAEKPQLATAPAK
ncbi:MAG TPA: paraquat-inducible protein A [Opitutaceae bacterium]|jgi:paraquat-inducible protein A